VCLQLVNAVAEVVRHLAQLPHGADIFEEEPVLVDDEHVVDLSPAGERHVARALHRVRHHGRHLLRDHADLARRQLRALLRGEGGEVLGLVAELHHLQPLHVLQLRARVQRRDALLQPHVRGAEHVARDLDVAGDGERLPALVRAHGDLAEVVDGVGGGAAGPGHLLLGLEQPGVARPHDDPLRGEAAHRHGLGPPAAPRHHGLQRHHQLEVLLLGVGFPLLPHVVQRRLGEVEATLCDPDWMIVFEVDLYREELLP